MTLTDLNEAAADQRPEPKRDRFGRYLIPHPTTGKEIAWTRASTWAKTCSDTFGLTKWELRMAAVGLARRPDLLAQAATVTDPDDKDAKALLGRICDDAKEAAGSTVRRNLGTALHSFTEALDHGRPTNIPEAYKPDCDAYTAALAKAGITLDRDHIERIVTVPELSVAGTFDRLVTFDGRLMVADLKTGRDVSYGMGEYAIQLALYAHGASIWDQVAGRHLDMPTVDQTRALVIHLPVGEARCSILEVDIEAGWEMAHTCGIVRTWRKRRDLARDVAKVQPKTTAPATVEPPAVDVPTDRTDWIRGRVTTLLASTAAKKLLADTWPAEISKKGPWTNDEIDRLAAVLDPIETTVEAPFPHRDPAAPRPGAARAAAAVVKQATEIARAAANGTHPARPVPDDGPKTDPAIAAALRAEAAELDAPLVTLLRGWRKDGTRHGAPWGSAAGGHWTERCRADNAAALRCAQHLYDADGPEILTRIALAMVLDIPALWDTWSVGAVIGTLTVGEADRLAEIATAWSTQDPQTCDAIGARLAAAA